MKTDKKEKVYITRDEGDDFIWVWQKPTRGTWAPSIVKDSGMVNYNREDINNANYYLATEFKKKYGITIRPKTKKCVHLPVDLLTNQDYKMISNDSKRKR